MTSPVDDLAVTEQAAGLAWPTVDPDLAVSLLVQEAQLLQMQVSLTHTPLDEVPVLRDLSPLGR